MKLTRTFPEVVYRRGVYLPAHDLWLDPWDDQPFAFVSHAHSDHIARHREVILSITTARLMAARLPGERLEHRLEFLQPAEHIRPGLRITLLPAGHIAGSAQALVESSGGGTGSVLYTGDFKLRASLSSEPTQWTQADTLIMETTFGQPRYRFPPTADVLAQIVKFCQEAIEENVVPVLFGYSLGKSQEILCALAKAGLPAMLHGAVYRMTEIYRELQPDFPHFERYVAGETAGKVLICPPSANHSRMLQKIKARRTAMLSGWAVQPGAVYRYQTDAAFALSDHAGFDVAWVCRSVCARSAQSRDRSVGAQRGESTRIDAGGRCSSAAARSISARLDERAACSHAARRIRRAGTLRVHGVCRGWRADCRHHGQAQEDRSLEHLPSRARLRRIADRHALSDRPILRPE
jgi:hypothetical protein